MDKVLGDSSRPDALAAWLRYVGLEISKELDGSFLQVDNSAVALFTGQQQVWGTLTLQYRHPAGVSQPEPAALTRLGFAPKAGAAATFVCTIPVKGLIYPALAGIPADPFKVKRDITFYAPPSGGAGPKVALAVLLPLAWAVDLATLPFQVLGLTVLAVRFTVTGGTLN